MRDFFQNIEAAPADAILGIKQIYNADERSNKIDLSIGIYQNEQGRIPTLDVVDEAMKRLSFSVLSGGYLPIEGLPTYINVVKQLLFGDDLELLQRIVTVQSLGGTGALKYGADFLNRYYPRSVVYISDPTWANHRGVFERAGFKVETYPYYDAETHDVNFAALKQKFANMAPDSIVILHTCCHNPTGVDLSPEQWGQLVEIIKDRELIPFLDFAYQGFAYGIEDDALPIKLLLEADVQFMVANSFSKNFSLYRRRIGALSVVCQNEKEAQTLLTQLRTDIRTNNSNPPIDGAAIVACVLGDTTLRAKWEHEVAAMRNRIADMRQKFVAGLNSYGLGRRFGHLLNQHGMFSFSGLTREEVEILKRDFAIYTIGNGRICMAAINDHNLNQIVESIARVVAN